MKQKKILYRLIITAVCVALCLVLPIALHAIPNAGNIFSPMHIPVLLCGMVCGWQYGLLCGLTGPLLSSLITSMPAFANLPFMMVELAVYGAVSGFLVKLLHKQKSLLRLYVPLLTAMLSGRVVAGILRAIVFAGEGYGLSLWATAYFVTTFPGILLHLILVPILYLALKRAGLLPPDDLSGN